MFFRKLPDDFIIRMVDQFTEKLVGYVTLQCHLIPVFLIEMIGSFNTLIAFTQFDGIIRGTFHARMVRMFQIDQQEHAVYYFKNKGAFVERETFGYGRLT